MEITGTTSASQAAAQSTTASTGTTDVSKDDFLKLLITQMQNQDPLNPMDDTTFLSQLAQFSSLEQMQNLNEAFSQSMGLTQTMSNSAAAGLIGRKIQASGNSVSLAAGGSASLQYSLAQQAQSVTIAISNSSGQVVRTIASAAGAQGSNNVAWDGRDNAGTAQPAGTYTYQVTATDANGLPVTASTDVAGTVTGVSYQNGAAYLLVGDQEVPLANVTEVTAQ